MNLSLAYLLTSTALAGAVEVTRAHVPEAGTSQVEANGLTFHYFEEGDPGAPLVLLLHGFPDTAHTWDDVRPALAEAGYHAVSPFTRGYAPTDVPDTDTDVETMGRDVLALIEALGYDSAILVAHDFGASAAYSATVLDPSKVDRLVTVAIPHPDTIKAGLGLLWSARHFAYLTRPSAVRRMQRADFQHVDDLYTRWSPTWDVPAEETESVKNAFAREPSLNAALGYYRALGAAPDFMKADIAVPSMLVGGRDDMLSEEAFTVDSAERFTGPYRVEMLDGGHFVHRESPEAFLAILLDFLAE